MAEWLSEAQAGPPQWLPCLCPSVCELEVRERAGQAVQGWDKIRELKGNSIKWFFI